MSVLFLVDFLVALFVVVSFSGAEGAPERVD